MSSANCTVCDNDPLDSNFSGDSMRTLLATLLLLIATVTQTTAHAATLTIAAAADLKYAMGDLIHGFKQTHPDATINAVYGSSGNFYTQITQGAPYDVFFSADVRYPKLLEQAGKTASPVVPYAFGRLVLWSNSMDASKMTLASLTNPAITHIAVANPKHAPYGQRAVEALHAAGVWSQVAPKLVYGENISQTTEFVQSGNAQVGLIALSLAVGPKLASQGKYWLIPDTLHSPMDQAYVLTDHAKGNPLAQQFVTYLASPAGQAIFVKYGFTLPDKQ
jgi:molybdate transport system substrate-binding protein